MRVLTFTVIAVFIATTAQAQNYAQKIPTQPNFVAGVVCFAVSARQGWQRITFNPTHGSFVMVDDTTTSPVIIKTLTREYKWSVDDARYPRVRAVGHKGSAAKALEPFANFKYDKAYPFGGLLARGAGWQKHIYFKEKELAQTLVGVGKWLEFRINDKSLGDNGGALQICTLPPR